MTLVQTFLNFALLFNSEQISVILLISSESSPSVRGFLIGENLLFRHQAKRHIEYSFRKFYLRKIFYFEFRREHCQ